VRADVDAFAAPEGVFAEVDAAGLAAAGEGGGVEGGGEGGVGGGGEVGFVEGGGEGGGGEEEEERGEEGEEKWGAHFGVGARGLGSCCFPLCMWKMLQIEKRQCSSA